ncbi:Crp/Fnr family transcriptional regulator [Piscinibacter sp. HJYY11]|uniref:Crp/Fnr family transcriptional regulator n=1 Tax=Piscinibacter sp. HJYY11 TaxID=2801333 RepID=UPI00191FBD54|nr:helix-turn-helix domain-containing protein [Piscinibacter sp. HJYY11]MBL0726422.1 helix-turn-helix domain-containing protein [Piscinibacter sp. HJYY11]
MLATATATDQTRVAAAIARTVQPPQHETCQAGHRIAENLKLLHDSLPITRRLLRAGDAVYEAGERFESLHVVNSGIFKLVNLSADGREQVVGLQFKGDWLGFDGIATGRHGCDAVAMDTGEVWTVRYDALLQASLRQPALMAVMHAAMSREMSRDRDALLSICTLPADARVAEFLHNWAASLSERGLRTDQITLRMTRAEIGNYLGMKLETVSRALSRLARDKVIEFSETGRREVRIPDLAVLSACVQRSLAPEGATLQ